MNNTTPLALLAALLFVANVHAAPQAAPKPMDHGHMKMDHATMEMPATPEAREKMGNMMFDKIDANKDGSLSRAEFVEHHRSMSMQHGGMHMDHPAMAGKPPAGMDHHAMGHHAMEHAAPAAGSDFAKLDANRDGKLSKAEMAAHPMAAHFQMLDTDKNGYLSPTEAAAHGL